MRRGVVAAVVAAVLVVPSVAGAATIRVQSTTDTVDAGLVDGLLRSAYASVHPEDTLAYTGVGTGAALQNARNGLADVVITHAPSLEAAFVRDGFSLGLGRQVFFSDYVVVGPLNDPAGVAAAHPNDAVGAFEDIAAAGAANPNAVQFKSRNDNSGTNVEEQNIWHLTGASVPKQPAPNGGGDATRETPAGAVPPAFPPWYIAAQVATGQAANLTQTEACVVAGNGCYTIVDRGTFNRNVNNGTVTHLKVVSENNTAAARGGQNLLINPFSAYIVNPAKFTSPPIPNAAAATRFVNFLTSASFQQAVARFPSALDPAFRPDAAPTLNITSPVPPASTPGAGLAVTGRAVNTLPGAGPISGMLLTVQESPDGNAWTTLGHAFTNADGSFSVPFRVAGATATYRIVSGEHPANTLGGVTYNQFSQGVRILGAIAVAGAAPAPTQAPVNAPVDRTAPRLTHVILGRRSLRLRVSERARLTIVIQRRVRRNGRLAFRNIQTLRRTAFRARVLTVHHRRLSAGIYRVRITGRDPAGNTRHLTTTSHVR